ncbi:MAG1140 family protein [Mycoplasma nasistruthionis]
MYRILIKSYKFEMFLCVLLLMILGFLVYLFFNLQLDEYKQVLIRFEADDLVLYNVKADDLEIEPLNINYTLNKITYSITVDNFSVNSTNNIVIVHKNLANLMNENNLLEIKASILTKKLNILDYILNIS